MPIEFQCNASMDAARDPEFACRSWHVARPLMTGIPALPEAMSLAHTASFRAGQISLGQMSMPCW